jgi:hypothetical protein
LRGIAGETGRVRDPLRAVIVPFLPLVLLLPAGVVEADTTTDEPVLLVLQTATTPKGASREQRFVKELGIALDGVSIRMERPATPDFDTLTLGEQIEHVRSLISKHGAVAATWLTEVSPELLLQHLVVISTGRALVRLIEIRAKAGFEADLALAARELLGTAFLFDQPPGPADDPVGRVVESVREQAAPPPPPLVGELPPEPLPEPPPGPPPAQPPAPDPWAIGVQPRIEGGAVGSIGPSLLLGGALTIERRMVAGLWGRLLVGVHGGPFGSHAEDEEIRELAFLSGLGLGYLFDLGGVSLGPVLEAQVVNSRVTTRYEGGPWQTFRSWRVRAGALLDLRVSVSDRVALLAAGGLAATPMQDVYLREITEETIVASPHLSWEGRLGLVVYSGSGQP